MPAARLDFDRALGFIVSDVSRLLRRELDRRVRSFGLTRAQWLLLSHLARCPGASQSELADSLQQEKITVGRQVARLERGGWVKRVDDAADARAYQLRLSAKAERMVDRIGAVAEGLLREAARGVPATRQRALVDDLVRIKENLVALGAPPAATTFS